MQVAINDNFAKFTEALYVAEKQARNAVEMRNKVQRELAAKAKDKKDRELRELAIRARMDRTGAPPSPPAMPGRPPSPTPACPYRRRPPATVRPVSFSSFHYVI